MSLYHNSPVGLPVPLTPRLVRRQPAQDENFQPMYLGTAAVHYCTETRSNMRGLLPESTHDAGCFSLFLPCSGSGSQSIQSASPSGSGGDSSNATASTRPSSCSRNELKKHDSKGALRGHG